MDKQYDIWDNITVTGNDETLLKEIAFIDNIRNIGSAKPVKTDKNIFVFCVQGHMQAEVNDTTIKAGAGELLILPSQVTVSDALFSSDYESKALLVSTPMLHLFLHGHLDAWNKAIYMNKMVKVTITPERLSILAKFYELGRLLYSTKEENNMKSQVQVGILFSLLTWVVGLISAGEPEQEIKGAGGSYFSRFIAMLDSEKVKYHPVSYYARKLCITPKYLSMLCKRSTNKSAKQWIHDYVCDDIRFYLKATDKDIKEIAALLGFPNASFFGKYAKDQLGMSPNAYRSNYPWRAQENKEKTATSEPETDDNKETTPHS